MNLKNGFDFAREDTVPLVSPTSPDATNVQYGIRDIKVSLFVLSPDEARNRNSDYTERSLVNMPFSVLENPVNKKVNVFFGQGSFYYADASGMVQFQLGPGVVLWRTNCLQTSASGVLPSTAVAELKKSLNEKRLNGEYFLRSVGAINLKMVTPAYFFSDAPAPGGAELMPTLKSIDGTNGTLTLALENPSTYRVAVVSVDLTTKQAVKSMVDQKEMEIKKGRPFAVPKEK